MWSPRLQPREWRHWGFAVDAVRVEGEVEAGVAEAVLGAVEAIHGARINLEVAEHIKL